MRVRATLRMRARVRLRGRFRVCGRVRVRCSEIEREIQKVSDERVS